MICISCPYNDKNVRSLKIFWYRPSNGEFKHKYIGNERKRQKYTAYSYRKSRTFYIQVPCTLFFIWPTSLLSDYYKLWFSWGAYTWYIVLELLFTNTTKCSKTKTSSIEGHKSYSMQTILSTQLSILHTFIFNSKWQHKSHIFGSYKKSRKATMHQFFHADSATSLPTRSCKVLSLCVYLQQWYEVQFNQSPKRGTFMRERKKKNQQINQLISA